MKNKLLNLIAKNKFLKEMAFGIAYFPGINALYKKIYINNIFRKLAKFKLSDLMISIEPANICNSRCAMCPYQKMTRPKETMPMELFKKIVDDCIKEGIKNFNLNFYNEPFLDPLIFERIQYLKSKNLRASLYSNGSVVNEAMAEKILESGLDEINFSFDSIRKETYEKIRIGLNFKETLDNILNLIKKKKGFGLKRPRIRVVLVKQELNKDEVEDYKNFWKGKADMIVIGTDDNRNETSELFGSLRKKTIPFPCRKLWREMVVMSDGKIPLCCIDYDGKVILGDFKIQTLREIWESEKFKKIRELHLNFQADKIPVCVSCLHPYRMNLRSWW